MTYQDLMNPDWSVLVGWGVLGFPHFRDYGHRHYHPVLGTIVTRKVASVTTKKKIQLTFYFSDWLIQIVIIIFHHHNHQVLVYGMKKKWEFRNSNKFAIVHNCWSIQNHPRRILKNHPNSVEFWKFKLRLRTLLANARMIGQRKVRSFTIATVGMWLISYKRC